MKRIGIIGAMTEEVANLKSSLADRETVTAAGMEFCCGLLEGKPVVVVRSGVGKVNAAVCAQILADRFDVGLILNTGAAGSLCNAINIGDVVLSADVVHHDVEASVFGYAAGQVPQMDTLAFPADGRLRQLAAAVCRREAPDIGVHEGRVVSGDQFICDPGKKQWLADTFGALCCEMEGAAIGHTAYLNGIPFLIIRAISDKADGSEMVEYPVFEGKAARDCIRLVKAVVRELREGDYQ